MTLASGTKFGPCESQPQLGAGVMGEVYLARDTRFGRDLLIKGLVACNTDRKRRFEHFACGFA